MTTKLTANQTAAIQSLGKSGKERKHYCFYVYSAPAMRGLEKRGLVQFQFAEAQFAEPFYVLTEAGRTVYAELHTDEPQVDQPQPAEYPQDFEVTTAQRNYILNRMSITDENYPASHVIRVFNAREHAQLNSLLESMTAEATPQQPKQGFINHVPMNYTDLFQVWTNLCGYYLFATCETLEDAQEIAASISDKLAFVVSPEPQVDQPQPAPKSELSLIELIAKYNVDTTHKNPLVAVYDMIFLHLMQAYEYAAAHQYGDDFDWEETFNTLWARFPFPDKDSPQISYRFALLQEMDYAYTQLVNTL